MTMLIIILCIYFIINLFLAMVMAVYTADTDDLTIYPNLIYGLRFECNLNNVGVAIVTTVVTLLCLPAIIMSTLVLGLIFCSSRLWEKFCYIFRRKDD